MTDKAYELKCYFLDLKDYERKALKAKHQYDECDITIGRQTVNYETCGARKYDPMSNDLIESKILKKQRLFDYWQECEELVARELRTRYTLINSLPDSRQRTILIYHFILHKPFKVISKLMEISDTYTKTLYKNALETLANT